MPRCERLEGQQVSTCLKIGSKRQKSVNSYTSNSFRSQSAAAFNPTTERTKTTTRVTTSTRGLSSPSCTRVNSRNSPSPPAPVGLWSKIRFPSFPCPYTLSPPPPSPLPLLPLLPSLLPFPLLLPPPPPSHYYEASSTLELTVGNCPRCIGAPRSGEPRLRQVETLEKKMELRPIDPDLCDLFEPTMEEHFLSTLYACRSGRAPEAA